MSRGVRDAIFTAEFERVLGDPHPFRGIGH
jgi:hypothetical protein